MGIDREISAVRRKGIGRHAITLVLLLAFALQSYLTQTHIHGLSPARGCAEKCFVNTPAGNSAPFGEATVDCPLCQAIFHAGAFFAPAALTVFVPRLWVEGTLSSAKPFAARGQYARNGLSRAPPR